MQKNRTSFIRFGESGNVHLSRVHPQAPLARELGTFALTGEIVDSKCYLGVMNSKCTTIALRVV